MGKPKKKSKYLLLVLSGTNSVNLAAKSMLLKCLILHHLLTFWLGYCMFMRIIYFRFNLHKQFSNCSSLLKWQCDKKLSKLRESMHILRFEIYLTFWICFC